MFSQIQKFRLSPQQRHLWQLQQRESLAYHARGAVLIEGIISTEILREAVQKVVERHEILRTVFQRTPGIKFPVQVIGEDPSLCWDERNLTELESEEQQARIEEFFEDAGALPFDFERGPLFGASLITLSLHKHVLLLSLPALCADVAGLRNLVREIERSYAAYMQGEALADDPTQYADLSEWQNELFESEDTEIGREFWHAQDVSSYLNLRLPFEKQSLETSNFEPRRLSMTVEPEIAAQIAMLAERHGTSTEVFLLTCWQVLLSRLTGQQEIVTGTGFDGRNYEELEASLGLFAKYLPVISRFTENISLIDALRQIEDSVREVEVWQESFTWEHSEVSTANVNGSAPFFPLCFDFDKQDKEHSTDGVTFSMVRQYACLDRFKVRLSALQRHETLLTEFHYDPVSFEAEDIARLAAQFHKLLESAIHTPDAAISRLNIVTERERQQLLVEFNRTEADYPKDKCIQQLFEEQASHTPDSVAVVFENERLSYRELNVRANKLAHRLRQLAVGPDVLVGICMERSIEMLVGLLGILKAGGAYLPLDPQYPQERLAYMLNDARPAVLLTQDILQNTLPQCEAQTICLDAAWNSLDCESGENPSSLATGNNLAYVIYTSGSTGRPKGVMITHQGLVNYLNWCLKNYMVADGGGAPVHSSIAFDLTVTSLFCPLLTGQQVLMLGESEGISALSNALRTTNNFSLVKITPAHLEALNQELLAEEVKERAGAFIIGGEALFAENLDFWRQHAPETRLINEYGPTETVVGCCVYEVTAADATAGVVPIGRGISNTQLYLLDQHLQPVPIGLPAQLFIGGDGLARGYLHQPSLTAQAFIPHPFSDRPGARLYQSGDLARYLPDGNIEFLGRLDHQVKIRGFRIELGEIEALLLQHPDVRAAVVLAQEQATGDKQLVAYLVPQRESALDVSRSDTEVRGFLQAKLPNYMVPTSYQFLAEMPLSANGKVEREKLPEAEFVRGGEGVGDEC
ncbi:MAG: amino acid adenylation domain-containing protein, partial [Pyrinomonadaceae bacterium]